MIIEKEEKFDISVNLLVSCKNHSEELVIPGEYEGSRIQKIAAGCAADKSTRSIKICEGVERIGSKAFMECMNVSKIELPASLEYCHDAVFSSYFYGDAGNVMYLRRRLSLEEYELFLHNTIVLCDGRRMLAGDYANDKKFGAIFRGFHGLFTPARIDKEMQAIYFGGSDKKGPTQFVFAGNEELRFENPKPVGYGFERELVAKLIERGSDTPDFPTAELPSDNAIISGKIPVLPRVIIAYYNDNDVETDKNDVLVNIHLRFVPAFYPGLERVTYSGNEYFIYKEMYLSSDFKIPVLKKMNLKMVYDAEGKLADEMTAKKVADKYRLLSMIG